MIAKRTTKAGEARYDVRYRTPGGDVRTKTFRTRAEAQRHEAAVRVDRSRGAWVDPRAGQRTLSSYATDWLEHRPGLRARTRETYESQLRLHVLPELGALQIGQLTPSDVRRWHADLSRAVGSATVAKCYRLLRTILTTAVTDELIVRNPCRIDGAGIEHADERPVATVEEVFAAADAIGDRYRGMVLLAGFCGLRLGELLGLENRHLNLLHGTVRVEQQEQQLRDGTLVVGPPKSAAGVRTLALPDFLVPELEAHVARYAGPGPAGRVFPGEKGGALRKLTVNKHWRRARTEVDLPANFRFHDLRHTANTLTAAAGASTAELMARMGHSSHQAAIRYQHATRERDSALARALDGMVSAARAEPAVTEASG